MEINYSNEKKKKKYIYIYIYIYITLSTTEADIHKLNRMYKTNSIDKEISKWNIQQKY